MVNLQDYLANYKVCLFTYITLCSATLHLFIWDASILVSCPVNLYYMDTWY